jgi:hypothetical protein
MRLSLGKPREIIVRAGAATITARIMPANEAITLRKKHTRMKSVMGEMVEVVDSRGLSLDTWDAIVRDWSGIEDDDGKPVVCNRANKYAVMDEYPEIAVKIQSDIEAARQKIVEHQEELEKN